MENSIPEVQDRKGNGKKPFPKFGNVKRKKKKFPKFGNGKGKKKILPKFGNWMGMKKSTPLFWEHESCPEMGTGMERK